MNQIITLKILRDFLAEEGDPRAIPPGAILTPRARELLASAQDSIGEDDLRIGRTRSGAFPSVNKERNGTSLLVQSPATAALASSCDIQSLFNSPAIHRLKEQMCEIGQRMWARAYTDGNGGNLTVRIGENLVLCTPTLTSKGFMSPEDICLIDFEGNQLAGRRKRSSEALTHLAIMTRQSKAAACCHAHPPHATAFAVAKIKPPSGLIPEAEVFLGELGVAEYRTPGTAENARVVGEAGIHHQAILMLNHGVITWGKDIEDAYWKMENVEAYCQTVSIASSLTKELKPLNKEQISDLVRLRKSLGMDDRRE